jgi:hypothetical protein
MIANNMTAIDECYLHFHPSLTSVAIGDSWKEVCSLSAVQCIFSNFCCAREYAQPSFATADYFHMTESRMFVLHIKWVSSGILVTWKAICKHSKLMSQELLLSMFCASHFLIGARKIYHYRILVFFYTTRMKTALTTATCRLNQCVPFT